MGKTPPNIFFKTHVQLLPEFLAFYFFIFSSKFRVEIESNRPFGRTKYPVKKKKKYLAALVCGIPVGFTETNQVHTTQICPSDTNQFDGVWEYV
jgi:hypothetical protein